MEVSKYSPPVDKQSHYYITANSEYIVPENVDVRDNRSSGEASLSDGVSLGIGAGYQFNRYFRADIELSRRSFELQNIASTSGGLSRFATGQADIYSTILNGYLDFPLSAWVIVFTLAVSYV